MLSKAQLQLAEAAEEILQAAPRGMTGEALLGALAKRMKKTLPERVVFPVLRQLPQRFVDDGAGRWSLRTRASEQEMRQEEPRQLDTREAAGAELRRGCYVVFDLEATGQRVGSPATEIIQIAAWRWVDGKPEEPWMTFVRPAQEVPARIIGLTKIDPAELRAGLPVEQALRAFFAYVGDLPLIAHNGASYDGPLLEATCKRHGIALPATFRVLDTLPLARMLLPCLEAHRVGTLAEHFGCANPDAHRADADVEMLAGIVQGLERLPAEEPGAAAAYELLRRAGDPWSLLLAPPATSYDIGEVVGTFGTRMTPLLPERAAATATTFDARAVEAAFERTEALGRGRRDAQVELAQIAAQAIRDEGYAVVEAGTGTGKSLGYLLPSALAARASGLPIAVSTFTRVLQTQLVTRELPFVQQLVPGLTYAQLQGRANYLSLTRLAEELEEALNEERLSAARAWMLATLIRFASTSAQGNLDELGVIPQTLDTFLGGDGIAFQVLASTRSSLDDRPGLDVPLEFYQRARENAERADIVVINHALLFRNLSNPEEDEAGDGMAFAGTLICDEAHTLEDAATRALERRVEERALRRILRAIYQSRTQGSLVNACRGRFLTVGDASLRALTDAVDGAQAALDGLARRLRSYVDRQVVLSRADRERYGARVRIERAALMAAGGPDLKDTADTLGRALGSTRDALRGLILALEDAGGQDGSNTQAKRRRRAIRFARSLQRDLRALLDDYYWFWQFREASNYVHVVELERQEEERTGPASQERAQASIAISAIPINVGPSCGSGSGRNCGPPSAPRQRSPYMDRASTFSCGVWVWNANASPLKLQPGHWSHANYHTPSTITPTPSS